MDKTGDLAQRLFDNARYDVIPFHTERFFFHQIVERLFDVSDLHLLHTLAKNEYRELFELGKDSSTKFHKKFYDQYRAGWPIMEILYNQFIREVVAPLFDEDFLYQKFPTFRVHLPGNIAVGAFHKDADFGHPAGEVNFVIPLTDSYDTASIWVESEVNKGDFEPMVLRVGELVRFNGNTLTHGNKVNEESRTRVSMDFRALPISRYNADGVEYSLTTKTKFVEGEYYKRFKK